MCLAFSAIIMLRVMIYPQLRKWGFTMTKVDIEVDEDLPNFF